MKIKFFRFPLLVCLFLFPGLARAQVTVVRVDGTAVYLDTSSLGRPVQKGESFKIIRAAEPLVNPKTGKNLGLVYDYLPEGKITEVQPLYAVGTLPKGVHATVGQEAVLEALSAPTQPAAAQGAAQAPAASLRRKTIYAPVEQILIGLTQADITQPGAQNLVTLAESGQVTVWTRHGETLQQNAVYQIPSAKTPLAISAAPVQNTQTADIFAAVYDPRQETISTLVLQYKNGTLQEAGTLPYYVHETGCGEQKTIWAQKPFLLEDKPGNAREVTYKNGKWTVAHTSRAMQRKWLAGTAWFAMDPKHKGENFIYTAPNGRLNLLLANGKRAESEAVFGSSPNRVKYKQSILKFYPSVQAFSANGTATVAAAENTAKLGLLSETFGQYQSGKIHFMVYDKGRLQITDTVPMDGVVYDTACTAHSLLAAEVLGSGESSVVEIFN